jgi:hypothetical protein
MIFKVMELLGPPSTQDLLSMGLQDSGLVIAVGAMEGRITGGERMEYFYAARALKLIMALAFRMCFKSHPL